MPRVFFFVQLPCVASDFVGTLSLSHVFLLRVGKFADIGELTVSLKELTLVGMFLVGNFRTVCAGVFRGPIACDTCKHKPVHEVTPFRPDP